MSKLTYEDKINLYNDRKNGISRSNLSKKYKIRTCSIDYLVSLIDKHALTFGTLNILSKNNSSTNGGIFLIVTN